MSVRDKTSELGRFCPDGYGKKVNGSYAVYTVNQIKRHAIRKGKSWDLGRLDVFKLIQLPCHYCGLEVKFPETRNGLDRINNDLGYTLENVVPCCRWCNAAKSQMSLGEFRAYVARLYAHLNRDTSA